MMADRFVTVLDPDGRWAIMADELQWILCRSRRTDGAGGFKPTRFCIQADSLRRGGREAGIHLTPVAIAFLAQQPPCHRDRTPPARTAGRWPRMRTQREAAPEGIPEPAEALIALAGTSP